MNKSDFFNQNFEQLCEISRCYRLKVCDLTCHHISIIYFSQDFDVDFTRLFTMHTLSSSSTSITMHSFVFFDKVRISDFIKDHIEG